jgi:hypothetical protein
VKALTPNMSGSVPERKPIGFQGPDPYGSQPPLALLANDGVSMQTKAAMVRLGLARPEDFTQSQSAPQAPAAPLGDPTRKLSQQEYEKQLKAAKQRMNEQYLRYKRR